jgi:hypothetical protein
VGNHRGRGVTVCRGLGFLHARQRFTLDQLHGQEPGAVDLADLDHPRDAPVLQAQGDPRLALKQLVE